jgi:dTMP kinase
MGRGKLIVLDGTDGAGKATQTRLLEQRLISEGIHVIKYSFPNYETIFGQMITEYLSGEYGPTTKLHPKMASILYAFDRWKFADEIREHLERGHYVVCDRYVESNIGYQQAKLPEEQRSQFSDWLTKLEHKELNIPKSDAVIFLRVPPEISSTNMLTREKLDDHESNVSYQHKVLESYESLANQDKKWTIINCVKDGQMRSRDEIHNEIYNAIQ